MFLFLQHKPFNGFSDNRYTVYCKVYIRRIDAVVVSSPLRALKTEGSYPKIFHTLNQNQPPFLSNPRANSERRVIPTAALENKFGTETYLFVSCTVTFIIFFQKVNVSSRKQIHTTEKTKKKGDKKHFDKYISVRRRKRYQLSFTGVRQVEE